MKKRFKTAKQGKTEKHTKTEKGRRANATKGGEKKECLSPVREGDVWRLHGCLIHARAALLTYDCTFPAPEGEGGYKKIGDFYRQLCEATAMHLTEQLIPRVIAAYEACADARARYSFPRVRYLADFTVTQDGDGFFSVRRCARLLRGGREIAHYEEGEVFLPARGLLCPIGFLRANGCSFSEKDCISQHTGTHLSSILRFFWHKPSGSFYLSDNKIHLLPAKERPSR